MKVSSIVSWKLLKKIFITWVLKFFNAFHQAIVLSLVAVSAAFPVSDDSEEEGAPRVGSNLIFQQINDILKREIIKETKNESLEIGDKIKADDGKFQIQIQQFSSFLGFPLAFKPNDEEVKDKEILTLVDDFDGSSEYEIKKESSEEKDSTTKSSKAVQEKNNSDENSSEESTSKSSSKVAAATLPTQSTTNSPTTKKPEDSNPTTEKVAISKVIE